MSSPLPSPSPRHARRPAATPRGGNETLAFDASAALDPHNHTAHVITLRDDSDDTGNIHFNTSAPQPPKTDRPPTAPQASASTSSTTEAPQPTSSMPAPAPSRAPLADKTASAAAKPDAAAGKGRRWQQSSLLKGHGKLLTGPEELRVLLSHKQPKHHENTVQSLISWA